MHVDERKWRICNLAVKGALTQLVQKVVEKKSCSESCCF